MTAMKAYARTHIGRVRQINEDAYYLPREGENFAAVADGMGGHLAGEVASQMAVMSFAESLREHEPSEDVLQSAIMLANIDIYQAAQRDPLKHGMGTTLTALCVDHDDAYLVHVGDSRAYLLRNRALMQLSNDHTLVNDLVERGELTLNEAKVHPHRNVITRALGTNARVEPDIIKLDYQPGDVWLLCSDGLSNYLKSSELAEILMRQIPYEERLDAMVTVALERGGGDNITCMIILRGDGDDR